MKFFEKLNTPKAILLTANILLVFFLILLSNLGVLPFRNLSDFLFFSGLFFVFALYRPGWAFLFLVGTMALENINLAPASFPIMLRPYQIIGGLVILAILFRLVFRRLNFKLIKLKWFDYALIIFALAGFLSTLGAAEKGVALKLSVIITTFLFLYLLVRNYIQNLDDLKRIVPFFISSSVIVVLYGIWQNIRFISGQNSFETMPGRPNATYTEADWLAIFLVLLIAIIYTIAYYLRNYRKEFKIQSSPGSKAKLATGQAKFEITVQSSKSFLLYLFLAFAYIALILTVSRSSWLGVGVVTLVFLKIVLTKSSINFSEWQWKEFFLVLRNIGITVLVSFGIVYVFHLTNFQLFNRAQSTTTGYQEITITCPSKSEFDKLPNKINDVSELQNYNCRHINLEQILTEKEKGDFVGEILRPDPNVSIRSDIYSKSIEQIEEHPILGIGWGNIGSILGKDANSNTLNSSNIFLEVWLGSGVLGLLAFLVILIYIFIQAIKKLKLVDFENKLVGLFAVLGLLALVVPNLFNAGIFLGILWIWLGVTLSLSKL